MSSRVAPAETMRSRLRRQHLARRAPKKDLASVVGEVGGLHAQLASSAELAVWARVRGVVRVARSPDEGARGRGSPRPWPVPQRAADVRFA